MAAILICTICCVVLSNWIFFPKKSNEALKYKKVLKTLSTFETVSVNQFPIQLLNSALFEHSLVMQLLHYPQQCYIVNKSMGFNVKSKQVPPNVYDDCSSCNLVNCKFLLKLQYLE